jgi:hypothetical protein
VYTICNIGFASVNAYTPPGCVHIIITSIAVGDLNLTNVLKLPSRVSVTNLEQIVAVQETDLLDDGLHQTSFSS